MQNFIIFLIALNFSACNVPKKATADTVESPTFKILYDLARPDTTFLMPAELIEISALSMMSDPSKMCTLQDERGILYILDKKTGSVTSKIVFESKGDFEGLEVVGDVAYAAKSNGTLYEITKFGTEEQQIKQLKSFLTKKNNIEGLGYDELKNNLLLACKGSGSETETFRRDIFAFNLKNKTVAAEAVYSISNQQIVDFIHQTPTLDSTEFEIYLHPSAAEDWKLGPSAVALHPVSHDVYLLSSVGKLFLVLDYKTGKLKYLQKLDKKIHAQPEGIVFDKDGTLYISNEGKKGSGGMIHRFGTHK